MDPANTIIIDPGTGAFKAGLASHTQPSVIIPTVVGHAQKKKSILKKSAAADTDVPDVAVGDDALAHIGRMKFEYPLTNGKVEAWPEVEHIIRKIFTTLEKEPEETTVVVGVPAFNPSQDTEMWATTLMESFSVEKIAMVPMGLCALYAAGRSTGVVLESGDGLTTVTPVYEHYPISMGIDRMNWGGNNVTQHLRTLMYEAGYSFSSVSDEFAVRQMKEQLGYVAEDYDAEREKPAESKDFELPDGQTCKVGAERFRATEILFKPAIVMSENPGMHEFVAKCIKRCDINVRRDLSQNIVLSGGNTLFDGFAHRLKEGVITHFPDMFGSVEVIGSETRKYNAWAGASVLASLGSMGSYLVDQDLYEEHGPQIVLPEKRKILLREQEAAEDDG